MLKYILKNNDESMFNNTKTSIYTLGVQKHIAVYKKISIYNACVLKIHATRLAQRNLVKENPTKTENTFTNNNI